MKNIWLRIIVASLLGCVFTLGLSFGGFYLFKGYDFSIIFYVLTALIIILLLINFSISSKYKKKINNMKTEEIINFVDSSKEYVENNITSIRHKILNQLRLSLLSVLFILALSIVLNVFSGNVIELLYSEKINGVICVFVGFGIGFDWVFYAFIFYKMLSPKEKNDNTNKYNTLYKFVKEIFVEENIKDNLVVSLNGFNAQCGVSKIRGTIYIDIGLYLVKFLTLEELKTVIYHEIAHIKHDDNKYLNKVYKLNNSLNLFGNDKTLLYLSPFIIKSSLYNTMYDIISSKYYEELADDELLNKNVNETYAKAIVKGFGLDYIQKYGMTSFYYSINKNKMNEENLNSLFDFILDKYNQNIEYFDFVSKSHLEAKISTHPNVRMRRDKFFKDDLNIDITKQEYFDSDIKTLIDEMNNNFEKDESFILHYNEYIELKNKDINDLDKVGCYQLLNNALDFYDFDALYQYANKLIEISGNDDLALYSLGLYYYMKHDIKCEEYLLPLLDTNNLYTQSSFELLGTFYLETGNVSGRDNLREIQANLIDNLRQFDSVLKLEKNDRLYEFNNEEVINHINEIVKKYKDLKLVSAGTKKVDDLFCTHVLLVCEDGVEDFSELNKCRDEVFYYLDSIDGQYNLLAFSYSQLVVFRKELTLKPYIIYNK